MDFIEKNRQKVAETAEIPKTAPQTQPKSRKKPEKSREKVAETAEIPKTVPKPSPKAGEKLAKTQQTVKKIRLLLKRIDSLVG